MGVSEHANNKTRITTATDTQVKTGDGVLRWLIIPSDLTGAVTIYDAITNTNTVLVLPTGTPAGVWVIGFEFTTGIRITTAAADEIVAVWL